MKAHDIAPVAWPAMFASCLHEGSGQRQPSICILRRPQAYMAWRNGAVEHEKGGVILRYQRRTNEVCASFDPDHMTTSAGDVFVWRALA